MDESDEKLFEAAKEARENAHAPYSGTGYKVGASLLTDDDRILAGCNVESMSFGLTVCAERNVLATAIAQGYRKFKKILVVSKDGWTPCGACRQVIWDLCGDIPVIVFDENGKSKEHTSAGLFPHPFEGKSLKS